MSNIGERLYMNILLVNGSLTIGGNTAIMAHEFKEAMQKENHKVSVFNLVEGCDELTNWINRMERVDMLVFASPIYWGGMTGLLKSFIDRFNPNSTFYKNIKYGTALVNSEYKRDSEFILNHFKLIFRYLEMEYIDALLITDMKSKGDMNNKLHEVNDYVNELLYKIE